MVTWPSFSFLSTNLVPRVSALLGRRPEEAETGYKIDRTQKRWHRIGCPKLIIENALGLNLIQGAFLPTSLSTHRERLTPDIERQCYITN